jgi:hypothetical protein
VAHDDSTPTAACDAARSNVWLRLLFKKSQ